MIRLTNNVLQKIARPKQAVLIEFHKFELNMKYIEAKYVIAYNKNFRSNIYDKIFNKIREEMQNFKDKFFDKYLKDDMMADPGGCNFVRQHHDPILRIILYQLFQRDGIKYDQISMYKIYELLIDKYRDEAWELYIKKIIELTKDILDKYEFNHKLKINMEYIKEYEYPFMIIVNDLYSEHYFSVEPIEIDY